MICLDMDGTLLNDDKIISERNKEAIKKAHDKGVKIAISTGRLFTSAKYYAEILGVEAPIIASNGAYIREKDKDDVIYEALLGKENCEKIWSIIEKYNFFNCFNTYDTVISNKPFPKEYPYYKLNEDLPEDRKINLEVSANFQGVFERDKDKIVKAICLSEDYDRIRKAKEEIKALGEFEVVSSSLNNFEIMKKGSSKGKAVEVLAGFYGLSREEVICMGDGENDLSMLQYVGMGIAMGNAEYYVKDNAKYVTDTNNNDGVAKAIEKFVL
nr:Cof-type HAD-IIB family hydrolase [Clostridium ganghwense]